MLYKEAPAATARGSAHHQCLEVPDVQATLTALEAKPYRKEYTADLEVRTGRNRSGNSTFRPRTVREPS
jgi:lactoylglutathione lyase